MFNGFCYLAQDELLSWEDARTACLSKGAHLASIQDEGEQGELFSLLHAGPSCPDGFTLDEGTKRCYKYIEESLSWAAAVNACKEADSKLALVNNNAANEQVMQFVTGDTLIWVGISDNQEEGVWRYSNNQKVGDFNKWVEGSPDGGEDENCASMSSDGSWDDKNCTLELPFVCTKAKGNDHIEARMQKFNFRF